MDALVKKILEKIKNPEEDSILFDSSDLPSFKIDKNNFLKIIEKTSDKKIAFVDGGNLEIIRSPSLSLFFNRIYYNIYKYNKRIKSGVFEFYTLITAISKENKIFFKTEYFFTKNKIDLQEYEFDSFDRSLIFGNRRAAISSIGNVIRRFAEISVAKSIDDVSVILLDGCLEAKYSEEDKHLQELFNTKKVVCGLAKTTSLITKKGNSLAVGLSAMADDKKWLYCAGKIKEKEHSADIYFLKLNKKSEYMFRFEVNNLKEYDINELFCLLEENSKDPIFLGYPYGLIDADRFARVSKKEREALELQLKIKFGKDFEKIKPYLNSLNAHDILDNIS